ncbi:hypothetical protein [Sporolactobacillus nakayamae]|uniref:Uncharacterized protein n=1 Tax=Sporolactobacillus nakayamae TaxID=269670 RepID=A0A1I2Q7J1_9BACL|nr:hypothetical protein [Sporolactobacillus nakayamae]SFG23623.1 hypothetical protein SAMN02982927_01079 [Sporolactobacillus nakayamae]
MIHELELFVQDKLDDSKPHLAKVISVLAENQSGGARAPAGAQAKGDPADYSLSGEAPGLPAASEQPKRRFSTEKTRTHDTWLVIKDRAFYTRFFLVKNFSLSMCEK